MAKKKTWIIILVILAALLTAGWFVGRSILERRRPMHPVPADRHETDAAESNASSFAEKVKEEKVEKEEPEEIPVTYTNYVLVGLDVRDQKELKQANSDTMIIASINNANGNVRLAAIYRDTLLNINRKDGDEMIDRILQKDREIRAAAGQVPALSEEEGASSGSGEAGLTESAAAESGAESIAETVQVPVSSLEKAYEEAMQELLYEYAPADLGRYDKANAAYANGSDERLIWMLENNLDLKIDGFFVVNFSAVSDVVDDLGGIDVWMTEQEVIHMNNYCVETSEVTGKEYIPIEPETEAREYHLNGVQAVSYARIRYTAGNDMKRSQRQRVVINKIADKASRNELKALKSIIRHILPNCRTSISVLDLFSYAANARFYQIEKSTGFPTLHIEQHCWPNGEELDPVVPVTLADNVRDLHSFLFDEEVYTPSLNVRAFSRGIEDITGLTEADRADAEKNSVIGESGGEADVVR